MTVFQNSASWLPAAPPWQNKVRITLDIAEELVRVIDQIRDQIVEDRAALSKTWLHEGVRQQNRPKLVKLCEDGGQTSTIHWVGPMVNNVQ
jgi:hypothetical protein